MIAVDAVVNLTKLLTVSVCCIRQKARDPVDNSELELAIRALVLSKRPLAPAADVHFPIHLNSRAEENNVKAERVNDFERPGFMQLASKSCDVVSSPAVVD